MLERPSWLPLTPDKIFIQSIDREHFLLNVVKAVVFQIVMHRCESWTIKKAVC